METKAIAERSTRTNVPVSRCLLHYSCQRRQALAKTEPIVDRRPISCYNGTCKDYKPIITNH